MIKDDPVPVLLLHDREGVLVDGVQVLACRHAGLHRRMQVGDEGPGPRQPLRDRLRRRQRRATPRNERPRLQLGDVVQRLRPVREIRIAGIRRGVELDQVAGEEDLLFRQPGDGVALRVPAAELQQLHLQPAQPDAHRALEGDRRPGQSGGHRFDIAEQAREAADLAGLVLLAALDDEVVGVAAGDHLLRRIGGGAQHPDRVVMAEHHVLDRLVGDLADAADDVLRHHRRGLGVDDHHRVVANDDPGVGIALGRVGVGVVAELDEGDLLLLDVGVAGELLGRLGHEVSWRLLAKFSKAELIC